MIPDIYIVVPVYNEASVIADVINDLKRCGYYHIIVVDDGSCDDSYMISRGRKVIALRHRINRGKGAAVKTGFVAANTLGAEIIVTIDGDGQHNPEDIIKLIQPIIEKKADVVLGTRLKDTTGMPVIKVLANKIGNVITWGLYGIRVSDSQSGFRAYSQLAANLIDTKADKYEYDSQVLREIKDNKLRFMEVPIEVKYTEYSMGKKQKQGFVNGIKTFIRMVWDKLV